MALYACTAVLNENPASRIQAIVALWCRRFAGPGLIRPSMRPIAQEWRNRASRIEIARWRMAVFQSAPSEGNSASLNTMSTMPSRRSPLLATCLYSAMGTTPSSLARLRMLRDSIPPGAEPPSAEPSRPPSLADPKALDKCTAYTYPGARVYGVHQGTGREAGSDGGKGRLRIIKGGVQSELKQEDRGGCGRVLHR